MKPGVLRALEPSAPPPLQSTGLADERRAAVGELSGQSLLLTVAQVAGLAAQFGAGVLLARILGPSGSGVVAALLVLPTLMQVLGGFGLGVAAIYHIRQRRCEPAEAAGLLLSVSLAVGMGSLAVFALGQGLFLREVIKAPELPATIAWLAMASVTPLLVAQFSGNVVVAVGNVRMFAGLAVGQAALRVGLVALFLAALGWGVSGAVAAHVLQVTAGALGLLWLASGAWVPRLALPGALLRDLARFGVKAHLSKIALYLNYRLDILLVAALLEPASVGFYAVAVGVAEVLFVLPNAVGLLVFRQVAGGGSGETDRLTAQACRILLGIAVVAALLLASVAGPLVTWVFGQEFRAAVGPLRMLLPGVVAMSVAKVLFNYFFGKNRPGLTAGVSGLGLVGNIGLNLLLIPRWGIWGAALASSLSYAFCVVVAAALYQRLSGLGWGEALLPRRADVAELRRSCLAVAGRGIRGA